MLTNVQCLSSSLVLTAKMKAYSIDNIPYWKYIPHKFRSPIKLLLTLILVLLSTAPLFVSANWSSIWLYSSSGSKCNIFRGNWIPFPQGPYYTNATCKEIFDQQNCMKFGRPDSEFLRWRWKPNECELPLFNATEFLELVRGNSMAFVGDSLGRNQMQSLMCLLSPVATPSHLSSTEDSRNRYWFYSEYNFTIAAFWSPYLVEATDADPSRPNYSRLMNLYLDRANEVWASRIETFDYVIISAERWFFGPQIYFEHDKVFGCFNCPNTKLKNYTMFYGYTRAFRTTFKTLLGLKNFKGVTFLRALSPAHFENGEWNKGGNCPSTRPVFDRRKKKLNWGENELYAIQKEEIRRADKQGKIRGLKFKLIDATDAMLVRPDGHPNHYGHWPHENVSIADCVHWCLPGPIDTWNEFLLQMLKDLEEDTNTQNKTNVKF